MSMVSYLHSGVDQACHTTGKHVFVILENNSPEQKTRNKKAWPGFFRLCTRRTAAWCECSSIFSRSHATKWRHIAIHTKEAFTAGVNVFLTALWGSTMVFSKGAEFNAVIKCDSRKVMMLGLSEILSKLNSLTSFGYHSNHSKLISFARLSLASNPGPHLHWIYDRWEEGLGELRHYYFFFN